MKYLLTTLFFVSVLLAGQKTEACEIEFKILGDENKESFKAGDEIIVQIDVVFTHRVCPEGIENTKFKYEGMAVLGATKWKETANGKFERKLKLKVLEGDEKEMILEAIRKCDKEGGYAKLSIKRASIV
ncbi:hypothetical protein OU798_05100 [Prolixibacteraceae bacterium Z1-6]|uniref:Uncharacterized protein n=1 Tax=Draconibacterium aestuarii TaxID=2998507 RepID=A0A9X3F4M4_9BACT|nr:hypothetical protein [Prolixibacteraceae bacterium Z1-6]